MNTPNTELELNAKQQELAVKWAKIGPAVNILDLKLQAMAQSILKRIVIPTEISQIATAEQFLKDIGPEYLLLVSERKALTSKFDAVSTYLMISEKLVAEALDVNSNFKKAILTLKQLDAKNKEKLKWHDDEIKSIKEKITNYINNHDAVCKSLILGQTDKAYSYALGNGDIKLEELDSYLVKCMKRFTNDDFDLIKPMLSVTFKIVHITEVEFLEIYDNLSADVKSPTNYMLDYHEAIISKFEFYNIAVKNKVASLEQASHEKLASEAKILKEKEAAETTAKLNAIATVHNAIPVSTHKDLKRVYVIDSGNNEWPDAVVVVAAFVANYEAVKDGVRVKDIWNLSIQQMANCLAWYKNKQGNEDWNCGVKFKIEEKI